MRGFILSVTNRDGKGQKVEFTSSMECASHWETEKAAQTRLDALNGVTIDPSTEFEASATIV